MSDLRKAAEIALDALQEINKLSIGKNAICLPAEIDDAMDALRAALAEPVQEPVAWLTPRTLDSYMRPDLGYETCSKSDYGAFPVYTAPPQRKPLTDEEIGEMWIGILEATHLSGVHQDGLVPFRFTRAIERAHGIGT